MEEAKALIAALGDTYGDLAVSLNETTKQLTKYLETQKQIWVIEQAAAMAQLNDEIVEQEENLAKLNAIWQRFEDERRLAIRQNRPGPIEGALQQWGVPTRIFPEREVPRDPQQTEVAEQIKVAEQQLAALQRRAERIETGYLDDIAGGDAPIPRAAPTPDAAPDPAADQLAQQSLDWTRRVHQLQLQQTEDRFDREKKLIDERYDHEIAKAEEAGAARETLDNIQRARVLELAAVRQQAEKELAKERQRLAKERRDRITAAQDDVWQGDIVSRYSGQQRQLAMLNLQERQELRDAQTPKERGLIRDKYDQQRQQAETIARAELEDQVARAQIELNATRSSSGPPKPPRPKSGSPLPARLAPSQLPGWAAVG